MPDSDGWRKEDGELLACLACTCISSERRVAVEDQECCYQMPAMLVHVTLLSLLCLH